MESQMTRKKLVPVLIILLVVACSRRSEGLKQNDMPSFINQFLLMHVKYHSLNDEISARTLDNYISILDYGKYYFYKKDIESFSAYKNTIDDMLNQGQYDFIYRIYDTYKERFDQNMTMVEKLIDMNHDFNIDESMPIDRETYDFASTPAEMQERWRKSIKLQLLNYISAGKKIDEARTRLKKKYQLVKKSVDELSNDELLSRFLNSVSTALDPHSNYLSKEEHEDFTIQMELKLEGIGVRLRSEDGFVNVESIITGGAADKLPAALRLKPNDRIVAVAQGPEEPVDVIDMDLRDVVKKIRGKKGTEVRLTILRDSEKGGTERMIVPITREEISLQDSEAKSDILTTAGPDPMKIGYINLPSFYQDPHRDKSSAGDMRDLITKLTSAGIQGLVVDLRGNPGGLLTEAAEIGGLFITSGPIVQIKAGNGDPQIIQDDDGTALYTGPLVILIDRFSASASEILAGAIHDYKRGIIIGPSSTYGKGTVQSYNPIPSFPESSRGKKGAIKVTTHIFYQPSGTSNQLNGIAPDIMVPALSSAWDIGEDKSRYPLKWEPIRPASYTPEKSVSPAIISQLRSKSDSRIRGNQKFRDLVVKIKKYRERINKKVISLKEESDIEKDRDKELEKQMNREENKKVIDTDDIFLGEAFNVTADYVRMKK